MRSQRCRLAVLALEVGGPWSPEASQFVRLLAQGRARAVPRPLRPATIAAFTSRWSALLAFSAARAFGASLLGLSLPGTANVDGDQPLLSEVLASTRFEEAPLVASRVPPRPLAAALDSGVKDVDLAKKTCSCSLHRDRRTPVAKKSVNKKRMPQRIQPRFKFLVGRLSMYQFVDSLVLKTIPFVVGLGGWPPITFIVFFVGQPV